MRKILLLALISVFLCSGCALYRETMEVRGANITLRLNGNGVTIPIGDGWGYVNEVNVINGIPGSVVDVFKNGRHIARLNAGGLPLAITFTSSRCYGYNGWSSPYPTWDSVPPEQSLQANIYKNGEFVSSRSWKSKMHDCYKGIRQSDDWLIQ